MERIALLQKVLRQIGVPIERLSVQGAHIKTNYLSAGVGKPVILLHGGDAGAGGIRWYPVIGPLSACFRVIVPDVVGYGESDKPFASYDRSFFSAWLKNYPVGLENLSRCLYRCMIQPTSIPVVGLAAGSYSSHLHNKEIGEKHTWRNGIYL